MKYYLWVKQAHGCDYTIACGETLIELPLSNADYPQPIIHKKLKELGWGPDGDITLEYARLVVVDVIEEIGLSTLLRDLELQSQQEAAERARAVKLETFERLKKELGL